MKYHLELSRRGIIHRLNCFRRDANEGFKIYLTFPKKKKKKKKKTTSLQILGYKISFPKICYLLQIFSNKANCLRLNINTFLKGRVIKVLAFIHALHNFLLCIKSFSRNIHGNNFFIFAVKIPFPEIRYLLLIFS